MECIDAIDREYFASRASAVVFDRVNERSTLVIFPIFKIEQWQQLNLGVSPGKT